MCTIDATRMEYILLSLVDTIVKECPQDTEIVKEALTEILYQNEIEALDLDDWLFREN